MADENPNARLIAMTDAVLGIAMTLLVLDVQLPGPAEHLDNAGLWQALLQIRPQISSYCISFLVIAVLAFKCVPDFLAVRGLATLILVGAMPLLDAGYMNFAHWQINFYKVAVYLAIAAAIWLGAQPWRLRDFFVWTLARPSRTRAIGATAAAYGLLLAFVAFTY